MSTTLLRAGWIVTMDPKLGVLRDAGVLIEDDRIASVARDLMAPAGSEIIDAPVSGMEKGAIAGTLKASSVAKLRRSKRPVLYLRP